MENWTKVSITDERYFVSDLGRFWSVNIGVMKTPIMNTGYTHLNVMIGNESQNNMKLYLISQNSNIDYDTYDSCVVCAENEEDAKTIQPCFDGFETFDPLNIKQYTSWAKTPESISCIEIGEANENQLRGVILASFNAG